MSVTTNPSVTGVCAAGSGAAFNGTLALPSPTGGDDSAGIQAVINQASTLGASNTAGQYVRVQGVDGSTYNITGLEFKSNVWLDMTNCYIKKMAGGSGVVINSMIRTIDSLVGGTTYYGNYLNIKLTGGIWDTNNINCSAQIIRFENVQDGVIQDVTVKHSASAANWAFQVGGQRIRVINPCVLNGSVTFQDGVHVTHGTDISVIGGLIYSGDDGLAFGIDAGSATETWDDEALTNVTVNGTVVHSTSATGIKVYYGINTNTNQPFAGNLRGKIDGITVRGVTGTAGLLTNGGIYVEDTTQLTFTATPLASATSGTLNANYLGLTGTYELVFTLVSAPFTITKKVTLTNGSPAVSWTGGLPVNASTAVVNAVDKTRIKNVDIEANLSVGSSSNDGQNSAGIYVLGATNLRIKSNLKITDTASGSHFALGNISLLDGGDFQIECPVLPAGPGLAFYNSINPRIHHSRLIGGAGSGRGTVEQTGTRGMKIDHSEFIDIPSNGSGLIIQGVGSGDYSNTFQLDHVSMFKASGATITRGIIQNSGSPGAGFVTYAEITNCDWRGQANATAIDQTWNSSGFGGWTTVAVAPDVLIVRDVRCVFPNFPVTSGAAVTIPAMAGYKQTWSTMSQAMTLTAPATNSMQMGHILDLEFAVDAFASGSRAITWPGSFIFALGAWVDAVVITDANKKTRISFKFDGTNYIQMNINKWI